MLHLMKLVGQKGWLFPEEAELFSKKEKWDFSNNLRLCQDERVTLRCAASPWRLQQFGCHGTESFPRTISRHQTQSKWLNRKKKLWKTTTGERKLVLCGTFTSLVTPLKYILGDFGKGFISLQDQEHWASLGEGKKKKENCLRYSTFLATPNYVEGSCIPRSIL